jgi:hypothetical protein
MDATTTICISRENAFLLRTMGRSGESADQVMTRILVNAATRKEQSS